MDKQVTLNIDQMTREALLNIAGGNEDVVEGFLNEVAASNASAMSGNAMRRQQTQSSEPIVPVSAGHVLREDVDGLDQTNVMITHEAVEYIARTIFDAPAMQELIKNVADHQREIHEMKLNHQNEVLILERRVAELEQDDKDKIRRALADRPAYNKVVLDIPVGVRTAPASNGYQRSERSDSLQQALASGNNILQRIKDNAGGQ